MAKKKYVVDISPEIISQLKETQSSAWENFFDERAQKEIYDLDRSLVDFDPTKLWAEFYSKIYSKDIQDYVNIKRVGFVQGIYFSTGNIRVSCPLGGNYNAKEFKILNPENLSVVLDNM
jgi:hypothetical protein